MTAFDDLMAHDRQTRALSQVSGRLSWDQETMMPSGAAEQRAEEQGAMEAILHARRTDPRVGEWLAAARPEGEVAKAHLRHIQRDYDRNLKVPADLATALARLTSRSQGIWAEARANDDMTLFAPVLEEVVGLRLQEAQALAEGDVAPYDALIDDYEPGITAVELQAIFDDMRPGLIALRERALGTVPGPSVSGKFAGEVQIALANEIAARFGYDNTRGRLDLAVHPFSSGSGDDVRITTRISESDPFNCIYSTVHETGHACYEQGIDPAYRLTPLGRGVSMGVHESQSRIYENQLGRSAPFCGWLFGQMRDRFGNFGIADEATFYAAVNRVHRGYIRTEADEVQYNLHIMLRFDLERALVQGDLTARNLETAWNDRFEADFGYAVDKPSNGVLQDVHWSVGLFGYFPTYSLGNVYAGCLYAAMREQVNGLDAALAEGDPSPATDWLRDALQTHGGLRTPRETIEHSCGRAPSAAPLMAYLEDKFTALYPG